MRFLDEADVAAHLDMAELIPVMREALIDFSAGSVTQPVRQMVPANSGFLAVMPALGGSLGAKLVTLYPSNADRGIDTHHAIVVLFDPETGVPTAVMDGRLITEMRTAAVSAVAADLLANPGARSLAVIGSGVQARSHIEALRLIRDIDDVRVWSPTPANALALADAVGARHAPTAREAIEGADLVVTATAATTPVLDGAWLSDGAHVSSVGAPRPDWRELDDATMTHPVVVDTRAGAAVESGDILGSGASIHGEIGELLVGDVSDLVGRTTVFKSLGMAIEDVRTAQLVVDHMS